MYITSELMSFFMCLVLGMGIGVLFDIFRIIRKVISHNNIVVIVQDCIFCILSGAYVFYIMYMLNFGQFRFYLIIAIILSNILYFLTISRHFINIFLHILTPIKYIIEKFTIKSK